MAVSNSRECIYRWSRRNIRLARVWKLNSGDNSRCIFNIDVGGKKHSYSDQVQEVKVDILRCLTKRVW